MCEKKLFPSSHLAFIAPASYINQRSKWLVRVGMFLQNECLLYKRLQYYVRKSRGWPRLLPPF